MYLRKYSVYAVFALVTTIAGQSALASPCNKRLWEQASLRCAGNQQCISNIYIQSTGNIKSFFQCKTDQWNQLTGDNKTVDEIFNSETILGAPTKSVRGGATETAAPQREAEIRAQGRRGSLSKSTQDRDNSGKYREHIDDMNELLAINPQNPIAYYERGNAKFQLNDYHGAIADFSKAILINPQYAMAHLNRGISKYFLNDYKGAISDYDKTIEMNPMNDSAFQNRHDAKFHIGDERGSCIDAKHAASLGNASTTQFLKSEGGAWCRNMR